MVGGIFGGELSLLVGVPIVLAGACFIPREQLLDRLHKSNHFRCGDTVLGLKRGRNILRKLCTVSFEDVECTPSFYDA